MKGEARCGWSLGSESMRDYHDREWGFPNGDDVTLFEKINLEGFQSGLSWKTVLDKRNDFRRVFHGFDPERVARMRERDVVRLLGDASIIRHRGKIESTINNARRCLELIEEKGSSRRTYGVSNPRVAGSHRPRPRCRRSSPPRSRWRCRRT